MNFDNKPYTINIQEDAKLVHFWEDPEEGVSSRTDNGLNFAGMHSFDIPEDGKTTTCKVLPEEASEEHNEEDGLLINIAEDSNLIPLSACSVRRVPRKRTDQKNYRKDDDNAFAALAHHLKYLSEESTCNKRLSEDYLFRKLMNNFKFGTFGRAIYVRKDEVYRLITKGSLSTLVLSVLTQAEKEKFKMHTMRGVFERMTCDPEVTGNALVIPEGRALFLNGAYDVVKRKRVEIKENDFYSFRIQANYIPNNLRAGKHFSKFLAMTSNGDKEVANRIMIMIGYLLVCGYNKTIWLAGCAPNSGKSAVGRWLSEIIGNTFSAAVPPQDMGSHFVIAQLAGAPLNLSLDISKKALSDMVVSFLKASSGDDMSVFQQKFKDATSQRYICKHLFATNYPLRTETFDRAFWNRVQIAPFTVSCPPERQDRNLLNHLHQESDEIVTLAMEAIRTVILNNWQILVQCTQPERYNRGRCTGYDSVA